MSNWLPELGIAIDQKSSNVAIATKQTKSHIKVLALQSVGPAKEKFRFIAGERYQSSITETSQSASQHDFFFTRRVL
jgi:hypothetical protein